MCGSIKGTLIRTKTRERDAPWFLVVAIFRKMA